MQNRIPEKESKLTMGDIDDDVVIGEFQSPRVSRKSTIVVKGEHSDDIAISKSGFKRRFIPLSESDSDDDVIEVDFNLDDIDEDIEIGLGKAGKLAYEQLEKPELLRTVPVTEEPIVVDAKRGKNGKELERTRWCFTYNNPKCDAKTFIEQLEKSGKVKLAVFQLEKGESGTPHFQGYMETVKIRTSTLQEKLDPYRCSLFYAEGSKQKNHKYCTKEEGRIDGPWYVGNKDDFTKPGKGRRTDLDEFAVVCLQSGGVTNEIEEEFPGHVVRYHKLIHDYVQDKRYRDAKEKERSYWQEVVRKEEAGEEFEGQQQKEVVLLFGPTAVGKTTAVKKEVIGKRGEDLYIKNGRNKWWSGYRNEENILIDEFNGKEFGTIEEFNDLTNKGCLQLETKGGSTVITAERLYIASNKHPCHWWTKGDGFIDWHDQRYRALVRRFKEVRWWNDAKELVVLTNPGESDGTEEWKVVNEQWVHFWKGQRRPSVEGDVVITGEDTYFTF
nr:MAG: replication-associated protein [Cressdnaviricota sp.]